MAITTNTVDTRDLEAMNCDSISAVDDAKKKTDADIVIEPKYDGFRLICFVGDRGVAMYTRSMKRQDGKLPHIEKQLMDLFPSGTVLDGEIVSLNWRDDGTFYNDFEHVQGVMLSKPELANAKQYDVAHEMYMGPLHYAIFDMPFHNTVDHRGLTQFARKADLQTIICGADGGRVLGDKWHKFTRAYEHIVYVQEHEASQDLHDELVAMGMEGSIVKDTEASYATGGRGKGWWKLKKVVEVDVIVTGFIDGTPGSNYDGLIGGIEFGQPALPDNDKKGDVILLDHAAGVVRVRPRGSCSGLTLEERKKISANRDKYVGRVMTIAHMGLMKGGTKFRHPQFKRWRPDKPLSEVIWHDE